MRPTDILFTQSHEWLKKEGDNAVIGITDFAVQQLSDLVYIDLPKVGRVAKSGEPFGEIESVKAVSDLVSPVSGEIIEVNSNLSSNLDAVVKDTYGTGWIIKVKMSNPAELTKLLSTDAYNKLCETEH
jgi:glycine cleavage system H protein